MVRARLPASPLFSVFGREPRAEYFEIGGPPAGMVRARLPANPLFSVFGREPRGGKFGIGGPPAGMVRARLPANPLFSVFGREPRGGNFGIGGPPAGMVRVRLPASPLFSVSGREPRAGNFGIGGPAAGMVRARLPANPLFSVFGREPRAGNFGIGGPPAFPGRGLLPANREPLQLRPGEQILHTNSAPQVETGRLFQGAVCSPFPANPCSSVSGSKFFTQIPRRRPGRPPFLGRGLLPVPREPFRLRSGEQILHINPALAHKKAPCRFIGKVLPSPQQFPAGLHSLMQIPCGAVQSPAGPSPAGHF